jgi:hypothetical protein
LLALLQATLFAGGNDYEIPWHTLDGGGAMHTTGGSFELSGTIGQTDASSFSAPMVGGSFELVGGFWHPATTTCVCPGDMNFDGQRNGGDIQQFTLCMISGGSCSCADVDGAPGLTNDDVGVFVSDLLSEVTCP